MTRAHAAACLVAVLATACDADDDECTPREPAPTVTAQLLLSPAAIDFGTVAHGAVAEGTVWVEHSGTDAATGEPVTYDIGVGQFGAYAHPPFALAGSSLSGFAVDWSLDEAECPAGAEVSTQWLLSDRWDDESAWSPPDSGPSPPLGGEIVRIGPGCRFPVHLSFTGSYAGFHAAALVVETVAAPGTDGRPPAVWARHDRVQQVYLSARVPGTAVDRGPEVAGIVQASTDDCEPGAAVAFSLWAFNQDGQALAYYWGDFHNTGGFDNNAAPSPTWTCPDPGTGVTRQHTIYALVYDADDNQSWGDGTVRAWGQRAGRCDE